MGFKCPRSRETRSSLKLGVWLLGRLGGFLLCGFVISFVFN